MADEALDGRVRAAKEMVRTGDNLPRGFLGPVKGWGSLVPAARRVLRLPAETGWREQGADEPFDLILVEAFTESLGRIETAFVDLASHLADGGTLLCDLDNLQGPRMVRTVLEGHAGAFDPAGSTRDPAQPMLLRRALLAASSAGLRVHDVLRVSTGAEEFDARLLPNLIAAGLAPFEWLHATPPARFWLHCVRQPALAGSVLLAGEEAARRTTAAELRELLPADWEIVCAEGVGEAAQWNRGVAMSRGDLVWFVRAGSRVDAATFATLSMRASVGPAAPACAGLRTAPGDISGLMVPRVDVLTVGPLDERFANSRVALEDYGMLLDCRLPDAWLADCTYETPAAPIERPHRFAADVAELVARWSVCDDQLAAAEPILPAASSPRAATAAPPPWQGREPRISLCMITRDEQRFLPECLERARGAVDEIIVVDTGSTDRTVAIAESFGARVLHSPWNDDFSTPRNVGLQAATGDWILVLDADEFLLPGGAERIRELVRDPVVAGYHLRFTNVFEGGKTVGVMMVRLFRNLPGIAYRNVIHEQVTPSLQELGPPLGLALGCCDVEVEHHGYAQAVMDERGKTERNERLFQKQLAATPDDVYCHYKYGDFLRRVPGRSADARRLLERCLELILAGPPTLPRELPYASEVAALCALEAERQGDGRRARELVELALRRFVPTPNLHYLAAGLALADGSADEAILQYRRCLAYRGRVLVVPIQEGITGHVSLTGIAQAWLLRGDVDRAQRLLEQAIAIEPSYEVAHLGLSRLFVMRGDLREALLVLNRFLAGHPDSPGACQQTMHILRRLGQTAAAREMGRHTVRLLEARALDHEAEAVQEILAEL